MAPTLQQVQLMVSDIDEYRTFYEDVIGLETAHDGDGHVELETAGGTLVLEVDFPEDVMAELRLRSPDRVAGRA